MITKHTALLVLLIPGLALLSACNRKDADDANTAVTAPAVAPAVEPAMAPPATTDTMTPPPMAPQPMAGDTAGAMAASGEMSFADMDKNHDGSLSKDEVTDTDMLHQHFSVADTDGNGMLSEAEVSKHRADMAAAPAN